MFAITFAICAFASVLAQAPLAFNPPYSSLSQSVSYSGSGGSTAIAASGTATSYPGVGTSDVSTSGSAVSSSASQPASSAISNVQLHPIFPPVLDSNVELFAHSLAQILLSSAVLNAAEDFVIDDAYTLIYRISKVILERDNVLDSSLAVQTAGVARDVGVITEKLYFNTITHMFAKLLSLNNRLTQETVLTYPSAILRYVEDFGIKNGISDTESVMRALSNGVLDFAISIGINNIPNLTLAFQLFVQELKALAGGVEK